LRTSFFCRALLRHAIEAEWPRRGTRLGAEHESAAPPQAAGAQHHHQKERPDAHIRKWPKTSN